MNLKLPACYGAPVGKLVWALIVGISTASTWAQTAALPAAPASTAMPAKTLPFSINVLERTRAVGVSFYSDPPYTTTYPYVEQLLRVSFAQKIKQFDYLVEMSENSVFDVPNTSVDPVAARGQLFLGGTYYASNNNNTLPVAVSLKQSFLRYRGKGPDTSLRIGRFEFFDGQETMPKDSMIAWDQANRISQRLIGNFGFSNGQRSFDAIDGHYGKGSWDITAMAGRPLKGVFNMNGNPELNVDIQYLAYTKRQFNDHFLFRIFGIGYHDGRTGVTKTDNRPLAIRQADHQNIRIGTYGADFITTIPTRTGAFDFLFWGVLQNGRWGPQNHHAGAVAVEGGYRFTHVASMPWLRGGFVHTSGDTNPNDDQHNTFFQVLPTPRNFARFPFFNMENSNDQFVELVDNPSRKIEIRADMHFLQLASNTDLWYLGGGAFDNKVFGYTGRPANLKSSLATLVDISSDYALTPSFSLNAYYAHAFGKSVVAAIYPAGTSANYGLVELVYRWGIKQKATASK